MTNSLISAKMVQEKIGVLAKRISERLGRPVRLMEVCGTHTVAIFRSGIRQLLPSEVELVSGPGCPVCVTHDEYMDKAIAYAQMPDTIITTFGDMLKVPGTSSSLEAEKSKGADIRIIYSPLDSIEIAKANPTKKVIFLAVGFETTAPTAAGLVLAAKAEGLTNLFLLSSHKLVAPIMRVLLDDPTTKVDGFILPGHVAVVVGSREFDFLAADYHLPGVVAGFEGENILLAIYRLLKMLDEEKPAVENIYPSVVATCGNPKALEILYQVYEPAAMLWRGMGEIPASGLRMKAEFQAFDIEQVLPITTDTPAVKSSPCRCGEVLKGQIKPLECKMFGKVCTPEHALGPCMVSVEGTCASWYKYGQATFNFGG